VEKRGIKLPTGDMIILDDKIVAVNEYETQDGNMIGSVVYTDPEEIKQFLISKEQLLKLVIPLEEFKFQR